MPDRLQQAITVLQTRFGSAAPRQAQPDHPARPSGIAELDALTGIGGWPVGRLSLLAGAIGSGKRTIAQRSVAHASREGSVVYIDFPGRLDPQFLSRLDADLGRLLIVRPKNLKEGMASARVLARAGADLVCLDLPRVRSTGVDAELPHLLHRVAEATSTLLLIQDADANDAVRYYASMIIAFQRSAFIFGRDGDLKGLQVEAAVIKNRLAAPGLRAHWLMPYPIP